MTDVFIIGSKGIPAKYGGFETFVEKLTELKQDQTIKYHVSCMNNDEKHFTYNMADCFNVKVPFSGPAGRVLHVARALDQTYQQIVSENMTDTVVYILGCRIGPLMKHYYKKFKKTKTKIFVNPDGLEWKRDKWNKWQKKFLRYSEKCLVQNSDLIICDSKQIQKDMQILFNIPEDETVYISYGADIKPSILEDNDSQLISWYKEKDIKPNEYYLIVGRFVPENNYETMISEFMKSNTQRDLVIITNIEKNKFYNELKRKTDFNNDNRVKFVGTVYNQELLKKIREKAFGYVHGHSVGGTNPSLLEGLAFTRLNLLLDVPYNKEVGGDNTFYFNKNCENLSKLINKIDDISEKDKDVIWKKSLRRIKCYYNRSFIIAEYEKNFTRI